MKKRIKFWLITLAVGVAGVLLTGAYMVASGQIMSREARETYYPAGSFQVIQADVVRAQVNVLPTEESPKIEVYAKAWLPAPIDLSKRFSYTVEEGKLKLTETPFESTFLGLFPQPYEMSVTAYVSQEVYESYMGGKP